MTVDNTDIKALHLDMARVLNDAQYVIRHLKGQRKARHLVEQDVRHLRDQLRRLDKHIEQLSRLPFENSNSEAHQSPEFEQSTDKHHRDMKH